MWLTTLIELLTKWWHNLCLYKYIQRFRDMNSLNIKLLKPIFAMVAFSLLLLITVSVSHAESILPFLKNKIKIKHKTKIPPPPTLSEVQIRNYAYVPPTRILPATPANVLGYGGQEEKDKQAIAKNKVNQSLINAKTNVQTSAMEELQEQEEALQIHIDRDMTSTNATKKNISKKNADSNAKTNVNTNVDTDVNLAGSKEQEVPTASDFYQLAKNKKVKSNIPLQVVVTDEISTKLEIQSLEKKALTHLDEELPIKRATQSTSKEKSKKHKMTGETGSSKSSILKTSNNKLHLPKIKPLKKTDPKQALIANARKNSKLANSRKGKVNGVNAPTKSKSQQNVDDNVPAFRRLMDRGIAQLKANQLDKAEESFDKAQRMIPKSSAVYFYLGQVALKNKQPKRAENFARRGLSVSYSPSRQQALWQIILQSAKMNNDKQTILEAKKALQSL